MVVHRRQRLVVYSYNKVENFIKVLLYSNKTHLITLFSRY